MFEDNERRKALHEVEKKKRERLAIRKSMMDYGFGILIIGAGIFFLFGRKLDISVNKTFPPGEIDGFFGGLCIVYGIWRIYRGYKKNYFK
jgi:hypothetical protein